MDIKMVEKDKEYKSLYYFFFGVLYTAILTLIENTVEIIILTICLTLIVIILNLFTHFSKRIRFILIIFLLFILLTTILFFHTPTFRGLYQDYISRINNEKNDVVILLPNFSSAYLNEGRDIANYISNQILDNNYFLSQELSDSTKLYNIKIKIDRIDENLTKDDIKLRGKRRGANFGLLGEYIQFYRSGRSEKYIRNMQIVIIDSELVKIVGNNPIKNNYVFDFYSTTGEIQSRFPNTREILKYFINIEAYYNLLKIDILENKNIDKYKKFDGNIFEYNDEISINSSIVFYHQGNIYLQLGLRNEIKNKSLSVLCYNKAAELYNKAIEFIKIDTTESIFRFYPYCAFFNLGHTYINLFNLTKNRNYIDLAENSFIKTIALNESYEIYNELLKTIRMNLYTISISSHIEYNKMFFNQKIKLFSYWSERMIKFVLNSNIIQSEKSKIIFELTKLKLQYEKSIL
jgi:hypothetical protein